MGGLVQEFVRVSKQKNLVDFNENEIDFRKIYFIKETLWDQC